MTPEMLDALISRHLDGTATDEDAQALRDALANSDEAADRFVELSKLHADLYAVSDGEKSAKILSSIDEQAPKRRSRRASMRRAAKSASRAISA